MAVSSLLEIRRCQVLQRAGQSV